MRHARPLLLAIVLATTVLAGCIGGDDPDAIKTDDNTAPEAKPKAETGSIRGKVVTADLDEVSNAALAVVDGTGGIVSSASTDAAGQYTFNGIAPGTYRLQVTAICCKAALKSVDVKANAVTTVDFQVEKLTAADMDLPYVQGPAEGNEWHGFIACGARGGVPDVRTVGVALCSAAEDPNDDFIHFFNLASGLKTVVIGMDWTPVGGVSGGKLSIDFEEGICEELACADAYTYAEADGDPPFVVRVDLEDITDPEASWANIETEEEFKFRIFAGTDYANIVYQQPFTVYWYEFYHEPAPEDFSPLPDA